MKTYILKIPDRACEDPGIHIQEMRDKGPLAIFIAPRHVDFFRIMEACGRLEHARGQMPAADAPTQLVFDF